MIKDYVMIISCKKIQNRIALEVTIRFGKSEVNDCYEYMYNLRGSKHNIPGFSTGRTPFNIGIKNFNLESFASEFCANTLKCDFFKIVQKINKNILKLTTTPELFSNFKEIDLLDYIYYYAPPDFTLIKAERRAIEFSFILNYLERIELSNHIISTITNAYNTVDLTLENYLDECVSNYISKSNYDIITSQNKELTISQSSLVSFLYSFEDIDGNLLLNSDFSALKKYQCSINSSLLPVCISNSLIGMKLHESKKIKINVDHQFSMYPIFKSLLNNPLNLSQIPIININIIVTGISTQIFDDEFIKSVSRFNTVSEFYHYYTELYKLSNKYPSISTLLDAVKNLVYNEYENYEFRNAEFDEFTKTLEHNISYRAHKLMASENINTNIFDETKISGASNRLGTNLFKTHLLKNTLYVNLKKDITFTQLIIENLINAVFERLRCLPFLDKDLLCITDVFQELNNIFDSLIKLFKIENVKNDVACDLMKYDYLVVILSDINLNDNDIFPDDDQEFINSLKYDKILDQKSLKYSQFCTLINRLNACLDMNLTLVKLISPDYCSNVDILLNPQVRAFIFDNLDRDG
ncbi:MAG: hypothetical protein LBF68_06830 [Christensenellaceae bacterium]|jgi:hypothetical protein|nr:hypothetical protein [Christensenellaceae bacterium]